MAEYDVEALEKVREELIAALLQGHDSVLGALGLDDNAILAMALYARQLGEEGRLETARDLLETLSSLAPENSYVYCCLGSACMQLGEHENATNALKRAVELDPNDITANTHLGELALEAGDLESAAQYLKKAVSLDPEGKDPFANRARGLAVAVVTVARTVQEKGPEALEALRSRLAQVKQMEAQA